MNEKILYDLLNDLATSYRIVANDKDRVKLSKYHQALNNFIIEYKTLQSKIDKAIEYIENHSRFEPPYYEMREFNNNANLNELYDILKEDK